MFVSGMLRWGSEVGLSSRKNGGVVGGNFCSINSRVCSFVAMREKSLKERVVDSCFFFSGGGEREEKGSPFFSHVFPLTFFPVC